MYLSFQCACNSVPRQRCFYGTRECSSILQALHAVETNPRRRSFRLHRLKACAFSWRQKTAILRLSCLRRACCANDPYRWSVVHYVTFPSKSRRVIDVRAWLGGGEDEEAQEAVEQVPDGAPRDQGHPGGVPAGEVRHARHHSRANEAAQAEGGLLSSLCFFELRRLDLPIGEYISHRYTAEARNVGRASKEQPTLYSLQEDNNVVLLLRRLPGCGTHGTPSTSYRNEIHEIAHVDTSNIAAPCTQQNTRHITGVSFRHLEFVATRQDNHHLPPPRLPARPPYAPPTLPFLAPSRHARSMVHRLRHAFT